MVGSAAVLVVKAPVTLIVSEIVADSSVVVISVYL